MDTFKGPVTRSRTSIKTPLKTPIKQEVEETPFKTPATSMRTRGRKQLELSQKSSSNSKIISRRSSSVKEKQKKVEIKKVNIVDEVKKDIIIPKIVGFMVKPEGQIFYGVSLGHGSVRFVSSEQVKDKIPFAVIEFYEKNSLWKTRKLGNFAEPVDMKPKLAICDKNDWDNMNEDVSDGRCVIQ